jgi:hypothetical protein
MGWFSKAKVVDESALVDGENSVSTGKQDPFSSKKSKDSRDTDKLDDDTPMIDEDEDLNAKAQDVMADNLDVMRDIVFRIREDPDFAKSIYGNCPRLQELLKKHPDLRPIFEDPKLVRINFEKVYRDQGGVLPEDEDEDEPGIVKRAYQGCMAKIAIITSHPVFKIFKIFMILKKVIGFLSPTKGFGVIKGFFVGLFEDPDADPTDLDGDAEAEEGGNPQNLETRMQLNAAAEHMEDPEVQERMEEMLENPDSMDEAIENDPQLKALRDENPLCAELMSNPETMRILVDPENLRALGEAPDLIEQDFMDPGSFVPEVPELDAEVPEGEVPELGRAAEFDAGAVEPEVETAEAPAQPAETSVQAEAAEESNMYDDMADDKDNPNRAKAKGAKKQDQKKEGDKDEAKSWFQAAAGVVGVQAISSLGIGDMFGGDDDLGFEGASAPEIEAPAAEDLGVGGELPTEDPTAGLMEEAGVEPAGEIEVPEEGGLEVQDMEADVDVGKKQQTKTQTDGGPEVEGEDKGFFGAAIGAGVGLVAATTLGSMISSDNMEMVTDFHENYEDRKDEAEEEEEGKDGEGKKSKGRFAIFGAVQDFAKDQLISNALGGVVGDDLADGILDTQEDIEDVVEDEDYEDEDEDEEGSDGNRRQGEASTSGGSRRK